MGRQAVQQLPLSQDQEHCEALVQETAAVDKLESEYAVELDFGGTSTSQVLPALRAANVSACKSGNLPSASCLLQIVSVHAARQTLLKS